MAKKISKNKLQKIISEEIENLRDEMLLNEIIDPFGIADEDPAADRRRAAEEAERAAREADRIKNPQDAYGNIPQQYQDPDMEGNTYVPDGSESVLPGEGEVRVRRGQGYYHLARVLGLDPRDKKIRGVLRQLVSEKSPRGRSTLFTGRDYSWLRQHFNSQGQPRKTVGAMGSPAVATSAGPAAGMTRQEIGTSQQAIKDIGAGDQSGQTIKKAAALDSDYSKFTSFMTPDEVQRLEIVFNDPTAFSKVSAGQGNLMKQIQADEAAARARKEQMIDHAKKRVATLKNSYEGASLTSGAISMLAKRAGVLPDGKPNFAALERSIHSALERKQVRKSGQTGPIKEY